jgi:hypothetical protein|tara:strand:+ start:481 stop:747 length:267 start_codon:yes stop_codon:yes gene_type:complete
MKKKYYKLRKKMEEIVSTLMDDGKKRVTITKCSEKKCPYNQKKSPILRSNASTVHTEPNGEVITVDEQHSGRPCTFGVVHRIITETKN